MVRTRSAVSVLALCALLGQAKSAFAQPSGQDQATAQALFDEGKRLMQAGKYDEGCAKLVESQRLDPAGGTQLVIALCHEAQGKTATAWAEFNIALGAARKDRRADREAAALEHIKAIEPKLTKLRIVVPATTPPQLEVHRDGVRVGEAQWGTPLPIDPGEHSFEARAPGKKTWSKTLAVKGEGTIIDVAIPPLEDDGASAPVAPLAPVTPAASPGPATPPPVPPPDADTSGERSKRLTLAAIAGGVGLVATGVGVAFGASASSKWSDAEQACPGNRCTKESDRQLGDDAGSTADLASVFFVVGGVGLATGLVLWLTAPSAGPASSASASASAKWNRTLRVTPLVTHQSGGLVIGGML